MVFKIYGIMVFKLWYKNILNVSYKIISKFEYKDLINAWGLQKKKSAGLFFSIWPIRLTNLFHFWIKTQDLK